MSVTEKKQEITEKISSLTEEQLSFVIDVIDKIKNMQNGQGMDIDKIFEEAVEKYGSVLQKLAQ